MLGQGHYLLKTYFHKNKDWNYSASDTFLSNDFVENLLLQKFSKLDKFLNLIRENPESLENYGVEKEWVEAINEIIKKSIKEKEF